MRLPNSLRSRLTLASLILLPLIMLLAWWALVQSYHSSIEESTKQRLQTQVYLLLGAAEVSDQGVYIPRLMTEPRFNHQASGLYGSVHNGIGQLIWQSQSSTLLNSPILTLAESNLPSGQLLFDHLDDEELYRFRFPVIWETTEREYHLLFTVLESDQPARKALKAYRKQLTFWLLVVTVLAWIMQWLIMTWGLQPLKQLANDLKQIEKGDSDRLEGDYPTEVQAITDNLNLLLVSEQQQRSRYRNTLGDLAHSLKTPLAVVRGAGEEQLSQQAYRQTVDEQVARMNQIVQYQLSRAVKSSSPAPLTAGIEIKPLVERMLNALQKVYRDKGVECSEHINAAMMFAGDERDLMELLGNLLENAFKYGDSQVAVTAKLVDQTLTLTIEDDGPGVSPQKRDHILQRGARADSSLQEGQGIGLAVAVDILSTYGGGLEVGQSELGGACFTLSLPGLLNPSIK